MRELVKLKKTVISRTFLINNEKSEQKIINIHQNIAKITTIKQLLCYMIINNVRLMSTTESEGKVETKSFYIFIASL